MRTKKRGKRMIEKRENEKRKMVERKQGGGEREEKERK